MTPLDALGYALDRLDNPQPAYCRGCSLWEARKHRCAGGHDWAQCAELDEGERQYRAEVDRAIETAIGESDEEATR